MCAFNVDIFEFTRTTASYLFEHTTAPDFLTQVKIALLKCNSKNEIMAGALLLKALTVSAPAPFAAEIKSKSHELGNFISAIMKDKELNCRRAGNSFLESFLKIIERKDKAQWFRKLYDHARDDIAKGLAYRHLNHVPRADSPVL